MSQADGIKGNIGAGWVSNTSSVKKQAETEKTSKTGGENFVSERGDELLAFMGLQGKQNLQLSQVDKNQRFDLNALTQQLGTLDQSTQEGLAFMANNLPMFHAVSNTFEQSSGSPAEVLAKQNAFLAEFKPA